MDHPCLLPLVCPRPAHNLMAPPRESCHVPMRTHETQTLLQQTYAVLLPPCRTVISTRFMPYELSTWRSTAPGISS